MSTSYTPSPPKRIRGVKWDSFRFNKSEVADSLYKAREQVQNWRIFRLLLCGSISVIVVVAFI
jgi:hypothetical protein